MSETVIKVEDLGKLYRLGEIGTGTLGQDVNRWWAKVRGKEDPFSKVGEVNERTIKGESDYVWALKDINFEVKQGEVLGIIGRNGAGKSTLLKLLSKVTTPSKGSIKIQGRIASLLEVGTGFHPELTGRENIFLNGAILGMSKAEIRKKFDEILDFSGVERYIDTPVKRYSSGMYVRLAFAVAAFLEPEILIIDEVLAVGDAEFQKKCLGRMQDVSVNDGRTVLFVSHHIASIAQLCQKGLLLHNGTIDTYGNINEVIDRYLSTGQSNQSFYNTAEQHPDKKAFIRSMRIVDEDEKTVDLLSHKDKLLVKLSIVVNEWHEGLELGLSLQDKFSKRLFTVNNPLTKFMNSGEKQKTITLAFPSNFIVPGKYSWIAATLISGQSIDVQRDICSFSIVDAGSEFSRESYEYGYFFVNNYEIIIDEQPIES